MAKPFQRKIALHPQINQAIAVLQGDTAEDQRLVAYVTLDNGKEANELQFSVGDALRTHLTRQLPHYMVPTAFVTLEALPLTPNGKIDRKALPTPNVSRSEAEFILPRNSTEETVANIYAEILKQEKISINDNFFELGGHSLLGTRVISKLREAFKIELPLRSLFEQPTVAQLAERIDKMLTVLKLQLVSTDKADNEHEEIEL